MSYQICQGSFLYSSSISNRLGILKVCGQKHMGPTPFECKSKGQEVPSCFPAVLQQLWWVLISNQLRYWLLDYVHPKTETLKQLHQGSNWIMPKAWPTDTLKLLYQGSNWIMPKDWPTDTLKLLLQGSNWIMPKAWPHFTLKLLYRKI